MSVLLAIKFLTILPVPVPAEVPPKMMRRATAYYPFVGVVLGLLLVGADLALGLLFAPALRSALLLALWVGLTGALHLDGFLDCCDGLFAPHPPAERLDILRDVHAGSFAIAGGVLLLLVKYAALAGLQGPVRAVALLSAPVLARWAMVYAIVAYPYARTGAGLGRMVKEGAGRREMVRATVLTLAVGVATWPWLGPLILAGLPLTWGFTALVARWIRSRIPGLTGDTYGAIAELVEVAALVGMMVVPGL
jgi:adenosylcobinamide-GDP ribazoletransferase